MSQLQVHSKSKQQIQLKVKDSEQIKLKSSVDVDSEDSETTELKSEDSCIKNTSSSFPWFSHELIYSMDDFKLGERQSRGKDSFVPVTFRGRRCHIQTPVIRVMFGLSSHTIPNDKVPKYSLFLSLKPTDPECKEFGDLLECMDKFAAEYRLSAKDKYWSSIRDKDKKHTFPVLRVKINSNTRGLIVDIIDDKNHTLSLPSEQDFKALIKHHTIVKSILEVNPVWYAAGKYGISYRLLKIMVVSKPKAPMAFRD